MTRPVTARTRLPDATLYLATSTLPSVTDATELKAAYAQDLEACRDYKVDDQTYIVMTPEGVSSTPSAEEVVTSFSVHRYSDKAHKKLQTVGQYAYVRTGRVVASVVINTLPAKENDQGRDFGEVGALAEKQLAATTAELPA